MGGGLVIIMKMLEIRCDGDLLFATPINSKPTNKGELTAVLASIFNKRNESVVEVESVDMSNVNII